MDFGTATISIRGNRMHFEILVEDQSGKKALDILIRKIVGAQHTFNIYPYRRMGHNASPSFCYFRDKIRELI